MTLHERVIDDLIKRRQKIIDGDINCIPFPFERFRKEFPGIEQAKYLLLTASTKVGKTQITDFLTLYHPLIYAFNNPNKIRYKLIYFTLEMSAEQKYRQFICHLLYVLSKGVIRIDPKTLRSTNNKLPENILELLNSNEYKPIFNFFNENVVFIDSIRNPTGIYSFCRDYALNNGTQHTKNIIFKNNSDNTEDIKTVDDYYTQDDPKEYRFVAVDHYGLFTLESDRSVGKLDLRGTIGKWSNEYAIKLRNKYNFIICGVQQQAPSQESNDNAKLHKLKPTLDGLNENKATGQDADVIFGLFSPFRHGIKEYESYRVDKFRDHIRFLEIIGGREGGGGSICPLYFDGAVNYFEELPLPNDDSKLQNFYMLLEKIKRQQNHYLNILLFKKNKLKKNKLWVKLLEYLGCQEKVNQPQQ